MASSIPIRNVYYLYAYAWDQISFLKRVPSGKDLGPDAAAFFAKVLVEGCHQLFRRGVDRTYRSFEEELAVLRGRIRIAQTFRHNSLRRGKVWCEFDELQYDCLQNQLIKATLAKLSTHKDVVAKRPEQRALLADIRKTVQTFNVLGVASVRPDKSQFRLIQLHRNNAFYGFLLHVCELALSAAFPDQHESHTFAVDSEEELSGLFERFVRNFYRREQTLYKVASEQIKWALIEGKGEQLYLLPRMLTDVTLRSKLRTIVIDTKFYSTTLTTHRDLKKRLHPENLYQVFAYLKNMEGRPGPDATADGILLYPTVSEDVDFRAPIAGHNILAKTIDLSRPWESIHAQLLAVLDS